MLILLVGINGAGKSTFYFKSLQRLNLPFVNADLIASQLWPQDPFAHAYEAGEEAARMRNRLLSRRQSFVTETVFSHLSKVEFLQRAKRAGYRIILIYIHLDGPDLAKMRVEDRVGRGGHPVPEKKIRGRFPRILEHLRSVIPLVEVALIYDNSVLDQPFQHVATFKAGSLQGTTRLPKWLTAMVQDD